MGLSASFLFTCTAPLHHCTSDTITQAKLRSQLQKKHTPDHHPFLPLIFFFSLALPINSHPPGPFDSCLLHSLPFLHPPSSTRIHLFLHSSSLSSLEQHSLFIVVHSSLYTLPTNLPLTRIIICCTSTSFPPPIKHLSSFLSATTPTCTSVTTYLSL
ncbi:hypothetical protein L873DRAFT_732 [Choiromyces venosus 120613-1]|uniref:Uncharacterized protein n=1 Tax=Choiromyces venosus 120613-1 TaxID=1336337 RepID=A0A3N4K5T1_9PEZI|nr:hypothetical protein L873DRAFT_732 [Choiromyces venosus 120613-1]